MKGLIELNRIYCEDCLITMGRMPDELIALVVTSPPYDDMRSYNGYSFDFERIANELYRVVMVGGVVVWVVGDATIEGNETGTSFKQVLYFKEIGFNLHDTMIYSKGGQGATGSNLCYWQDFEYMFVLSKGRPKSINLIEDRPNKVKATAKIESQGHRHKNGTKKGRRIIRRKPFGKRFNIWQYHESGTKKDHPAAFPEQLAADHIISWSDAGDIVYDPFLGSGTTAKMAKRNDRYYIGSDVSKEYCLKALAYIAGTVE